MWKGNQDTVQLISNVGLQEYKKEFGSFLCACSFPHNAGINDELYCVLNHCLSKTMNSINYGSIWDC